MKYILICGHCGARNERTYLPEKFHCKGCDEWDYVDHYESIEDISNLKRVVTQSFNTKNVGVNLYQVRINES